jgi:hypothetical protein
VPNKLLEVRIDKVAAVDRPANRRGFLLVKSEDDPAEDRNLTKEESMEQTAPARPDGLDDLLKADGNEGLAEYIANLEKAAATEPATEPAAPEAASAEELAKRDDLPPEVREALAKAADSERKLEEVAKMAAETREQLAKRDFYEAAAGLSKLAKSQDDMGDLLYRLSEQLDAATHTEVRELLKATNEQVSKGALFAENGSSQPAPAGAEAKLQKRAEELTKADPTLTQEAAYAKAMDLMPDVAEQALLGN